jgi:hypothetical protein
MKILKNKKNNFLNLSTFGLKRAYSDDKPEYALEGCVEIFYER